MVIRDDAPRLTSLAACAGCAGKAGIALLAQVVGPMARTFDPARYPDLLVGLDAPDDAAVYRLSDELAIVQTVDFFPPVVDDPYAFGAIAAANAMSDIYAMGGEVLLALNIVNFPEDLDPQILSRILLGGAEKVREAGGVIAGGHTLYDAEPKYGLAVTGTIHPDHVLSKSDARPGDVLVLTKPLGTGIVLTAARADRDPAGHADAAVSSMLALNRHPSHLAREFGAHAMTDVTGFGLLGHAREMASRGSIRLVIEVSRVPVLPGALDYAAMGIVTGGAGRNREGTAGHITIRDGVPDAVEHVLYDPQTSGGLLIALPVDRAEALVGRLHGDGLPGAVIGHVEDGSDVAVV
jgi:selenide,water dikinase